MLIISERLDEFAEMCATFRGEQMAMLNRHIDVVIYDEEWERAAIETDAKEETWESFKCGATAILAGELAAEEILRRRSAQLFAATFFLQASPTLEYIWRTALTCDEEAERKRILELCMKDHDRTLVAQEARLRRQHIELDHATDMFRFGVSWRLRCESVTIQATEATWRSALVQAYFASIQILAISCVVDGKVQIFRESDSGFPMSLGRLFETCAIKIQSAYRMWRVRHRLQASRL
jgi:hypothetical protein